MLQPVADASAAARSLAEGLLDTRLPAEGRDEFGTWAASFNRMADALQAKITALTDAQDRERRFTADVAHELRTPLTALVNEAALLQRHAPDMPADAARLTALLTQDVSRLRRLIDDLLEISRLDAGAEAVRPEAIDLEAFIASVLRSRGWDERVEISGADRSITADRRRIERILANLVGNAIEHGGGRARVRIDGRDGVAVIEVADDGPGIAPEFVPRLFERFSKADPARTAAGSGLGLAIARENATLLGGAIAVESQPTRSGHLHPPAPRHSRIDGGILVTARHPRPRRRRLRPSPGCGGSGAVDGRAGVAPAAARDRLRRHREQQQRRRQHHPAVAARER